MNSAVIILTQITVMFVYMAIGWGMYKGRLITKEGSRSMASLLLYVVVPCVIIKSFHIRRTPEKMAALLWAFAGSVLVLGCALAVSFVIYRKRPIDRFSAAFSNAGFMGIPLSVSVVGTEAVFYIAIIVALINVLQWTYGQAVLTGDKSKYSVKAVLKSPLVIGVLAGLAVFLLELPIPALIGGCIDAISALNAPLGMIVLGIYMGEIRFKEIFDEGKVYKVSAVRLLVIPIITLGLLCLIPATYMELRLTLLIASCAPIGSNVAIYAQKLNQNYNYAVKSVCLSTILSVLTMPFLMFLSDVLWK